MKKGWEIKNLGEISDIVNGGTPDTNIPKFWDGENLWITPKDMGKLQSIFVDDTLRKITNEGLKNSSAKILPPNSIILSSRAPIGHLAINVKPISTNQGCKGLVPKKEINFLYLYYFLYNSVDLLNSLGTGATFKELSGSKLSSVKIPLPPLSEQYEIVSILDDAFESIERAKSNAEKNLKNTKELFESYIQKLIANITKPKIVSLVDACSKITQGPNPKYDKLGEDNYRVIKTKDLYDKVIHYEKADKISKTVFESCKSSELKDGDVLIAIVGQGSINKCNVFENKSNKRFLFTRALGLIRTNQQILLPHFLKIFLQTQKGKSIIDSGINGTSGQQVVTTTHLKSIQITLPTIEEQLKMINKIESFKVESYKLESIYEQKLNDLEELKKSILQKAFNGELKTSKISI